MTSLDIFYIIGAVAGLAAIIWNIVDWLLKREAIKISLNIEYEHTNIPKYLIVNTQNTGRISVHLLRGGFILNNGKRINLNLVNSLGWRDCNEIEKSDSLSIEELKQIPNIADIKYFYFEAEMKRIFKEPIHDDIKRVINLRTPPVVPPQRPTPTNNILYFVCLTITLAILGWTAYSFIALVNRYDTFNYLVDMLQAILVVSTTSLALVAAFLTTRAIKNKKIRNYYIFPNIMYIISMVIGFLAVFYMIGSFMDLPVKLDQISSNVLIEIKGSLRSFFLQMVTLIFGFLFEAVARYFIINPDDKEN
jgi:hypothetical protein